MTLCDSDLGPHPSPLGETMQAITGRLQSQPPQPDLVERLLRMFGRGDKPMVTMAFYRKLAELVDKHGDRAYQPIAESIAQSVGKQVPKTYFAKTVVIKLRALGLWNPVVPW